MAQIMTALKAMVGSTVRIQMFNGEIISGRLSEVDGSGKIMLKDCCDGMGNRAKLMVIMDGGISHIDLIDSLGNESFDEAILHLIEGGNVSSLQDVARLLDVRADAVRKAIVRLVDAKMLPEEFMALAENQGEKRANTRKSAEENRSKSGKKHPSVSCGKPRSKPVSRRRPR